MLVELLEVIPLVSVVMCFTPNTESYTDYSFKTQNTNIDGRLQQPVCFWQQACSLLDAPMSAGILNMVKIKYNILLLFKYSVCLLS